MNDEELKLEAIKRIESFREFKFDWNGYKGLPFSGKVINKALALLEEFKPVPHVFPTGRNSIQFEWEEDNLYLEMEIYEDKIEIFNHASFEGKAIANIGGD